MPASIKLPEPRYDSQFSLEQALLKRRSVRNYINEPIALSDLSQLLWAAQGITEPVQGFRTAPSAGATYPLEAYLVVGNVRELKPGVYKYRSQGHQLAMLFEGDKRTGLCRAAYNQAAIRRAAAVIAISAVHTRTTGRYGDRGIRYVDMEAGHAGQNLALQAVALGLATVMIGAFDDAGVKEILKLADDEAPLYLIPVGKPK
ncbi:MAG: SagB/ThcOx family dehydrogenase [Candidatus Edwardsbacteria bacterium]|nr:SagB/ThcOx family dehydrogenase [Candidatus Edwardsbacteria bacterium]